MIVAAEDPFGNVDPNFTSSAALGPGHQPQRGDPRRHLGGQRQQRRGDVLGSDARQGWGRRDAPGNWQRAELRHDRRHHRDGRDGDAARGDGAATRRRQRGKRIWPDRRGRGPIRECRPELHREHDVGPGQQPQRCDPRRHRHQPGRQRCDDFHRPDAQQGRHRLLPARLQPRPDGRDDRYDHRDGGDRDPVRGDNTATRTHHRRNWFRPRRRGRGRFWQRGSDLYRQRRSGSGQQPQRCDPRRYRGRHRQRRRGDVHGRFARQGRGGAPRSGFPPPAGLP